jgi:hypothetical protein
MASHSCRMGNLIYRMAVYISLSCTHIFSLKHNFDNKSYYYASNYKRNKNTSISITGPYVAITGSLISISRPITLITRPRYSITKPIISITRPTYSITKPVISITGFIISIEGFAVSIEGFAKTIKELFMSLGSFSTPSKTVFSTGKAEILENLGFGHSFIYLPCTHIFFHCRWLKPMAMNKQFKK